MPSSALLSSWSLSPHILKFNDHHGVNHGSRKEIQTVQSSSLTQERNHQISPRNTSKAEPNQPKCLAELLEERHQHEAVEHKLGHSQSICKEHRIQIDALKLEGKRFAEAKLRTLSKVYDSKLDVITKKVEGILIKFSKVKKNSKQNSN